MSQSVWPCLKYIFSLIGTPIKCVFVASKVLLTRRDIRWKFKNKLNVSYFRRQKWNIWGWVGLQKAKIYIFLYESSMISNTGCRKSTVLRQDSLSWQGIHRKNCSREISIFRQSGIWHKGYFKVKSTLLNKNIYTEGWSQNCMLFQNQKSLFLL